MYIILAIALLFGGGTSFVAQNSLPGDILYPVKINLNEEVQGFVAFGSEAKAKLNAGLAERRLEEAEKLAVEGRLNAEIRADIESRFEEHGKVFEEELKNIDSSESSNALLEINSNFEGSLKASEQILAGVVVSKENMRTDIESLLIKVRARLNATSKSRSDAEAKVSVQAGAEVKVAAEGKLKAAENKISEVRDYITKIKFSVNASTSVQAEARLKVAEDVIVVGKTEMEAQSYGKAFVSFQKASRIAQEAKLLVATSERINLEIKALDIDLETGGADESERESSSEASVDVESKTKVGTSGSSTGIDGEGKVKINIGL